MVSTVATGLAGQAILVVSGIVVARALGVFPRGQLASLVALCTATTAIVSFGMPTALTLWLARSSEGGGALQAVRRAMIIQIPVLAVMVPIGVALFPGLPDAHLWVLGAVAVVASVSMLVFQYASGGLQGQQRFTAFNLVRLLVPFPYAVGVVIAAAIGVAGVISFALVWALGLAIAAVAAVIVFRGSRVRGNTSEPPIRAMLAYGGKAQIGVASPLENFNVDQLIIGAIAGPAALGIYVVGYAFTNLPRFVAHSLGMVAFPRVAEHRGRGDARGVAVDMFLLTLASSTMIVVLLEIVVGWLIPWLFGDVFRGAVPVARVLLIAAFFFSLRRVVADALRGFELPWPGTISEIVSWVVFAVTIYPLADRHGALGAAAAYSAAATVSFVYIALYVLTFRRRAQERSTSS